VRSASAHVRVGHERRGSADSCSASAATSLEIARACRSVARRSGRSLSQLAQRTRETLEAYLDGSLDDASAAELEDALFASAAGEQAGDHATAVFVDRVARHGARLAARGTFDGAITREQLAALQARKDLELQVIDLGAPGVCSVTTRRQGDLVVTIMRVGLLGHSRVDVETEIPHAAVRKTIRDVLVDPDDGHVYGLCEHDLAILGVEAGHAVIRVITTRDGQRETVATYDVTSRLE